MSEMIYAQPSLPSYQRGSIRDQLQRLKFQIARALLFRETAMDRTLTEAADRIKREYEEHKSDFVVQTTNPAQHRIPVPPTPNSGPKPKKEIKKEGFQAKFAGFLRSIMDEITQIVSTGLSAIKEVVKSTYNVVTCLLKNEIIGFMSSLVI